jgi:eukaryotic-like serine/threonine-protein kinase
MSNLIGQSLGRYHILKQLGEGGMATVYKAYDTRLERDVAIKIIRWGAFPLEQLERILKRFEREAKALARLSHANIVKVHDFGEFEGAPFLVMEYLPGGTLKEKMGKPIPWQAAADLLIPVASALDYAHQRGILHRDVKPSNILLTETGEPMLTDFGIAKILDIEETHTLTGTGVGIGTPEYMAPEQGIGEGVDARADIYSLGIIFYELITGRKPYTADTPMAVVIKQINEPLPSPRQFTSDLPDGVEKVLLKAVAKSPENRYPVMGAFAAALESLLGFSTQDTGQRLAEEATQDALEPPTGGIPMPEAGQRSRTQTQLLKWLPLGGVAVLVIVGLAIGAKRMFSGLQSPASITQPPAVIQERVASPTSNLPPTEPPRPTDTPIPQLEIGSTLTNPKDEMLMVFVPEGNFRMGESVDHAIAECQRVSSLCEPGKNITFTDESPSHPVYLDAFWIDQTEVTNAMYSRCVKAGKCTSSGAGSDSYPAVNVSWFDASHYCAWAGRRLPTEAEWEKAARGTDGRTFPWGNSAPSCSLANFASCAGSAAVVGSYPEGASPYGAMDMAGNVWEWVADWFDGGYYSHSPQSNPKGPDLVTKRSMRGGSWINPAGFIRVTGRGYYKPDSKFHAIGFRCAANP